MVLGENVIGYVEGKGDNHLSNPQVTPLAPSHGTVWPEALPFHTSHLTSHTCILLSR